MRRGLVRCSEMVRALGMTLGVLLLPLAALADDDEKAVPLDAHTKAEQLWTFGIVVGVAVVGVVFYLVRRWQTLRSGNVVDGGYSDE